MDVVSNVILAAISVTLDSGRLNIYQIGTSKVNPVKWVEVSRWVSAYWRQHNVKRRVDSTPLRFRWYQSKVVIPAWIVTDLFEVYRTQFFLRYELPAAIYSLYANAFGTTAQKENATLLRQMTASTLETSRTFEYFTNREWLFDVSNTSQLMNQLSPTDKHLLYFELDHLDWEKYLRFFCYGIQRFVLQEEIRPPTDLLKINLVKEPRHREPNRGLLSKLFPGESIPCWNLLRRHILGL